MNLIQVHMGLFTFHTNVIGMHQNLKQCSLVLFKHILNIFYSSQDMIKGSARAEPKAPFLIKKLTQLSILRKGSDTT